MQGTHYEEDKSETILTTPSVGRLREKLKDLILNNEMRSILPEPEELPVGLFPIEAGGLLYLPHNQGVYTQYYKLLWRCYLLAGKHANYTSEEVTVEEIQQPSMNIKAGTPITLATMISDMYSVLFPVAVVAWLTGEDFRWHNNYPNVKEDLSYGLVFNNKGHYPAIKVAHYLVSNDREKLLAEANVTAAEFLSYDKNATRAAKKAYNGAYHSMPD